MEYAIIGILILYVLFLHYQIYRKNEFIDRVVQKLAEMEKSWSKDHIINFLKEIQHYTSFEHINDNKLLTEPVLRFLFENESENMIYIHYTKEQSVAYNILSEGFRFVDSFYKTAERITNDKLDLIYKHSLHKYYGKHAIIIVIAKSTYLFYDNLIKSKKDKVAQIEQVLTELKPELNENGDHIFTLSKQFIKGYVNYETGEIIANSEFNPSYQSPRFAENVEGI